MQKITVGVPGVRQQLDLGADKAGSLKWYIHNGLFDDSARYMDAFGNWHQYMTTERTRGGTYFQSEVEAREVLATYESQSLPPTLKPVGE